jgi:uncharacterized damage-inducible protein DinB
MKKLFLYTAALLFSCTSLLAQDKEQLIQDWERAKEFTKEYLDAMSEEGYAYKPTPDCKSFAQHMMHLAEANYVFAAAITDTDPLFDWLKLEKGADLSKNTTRKAVLDSYDNMIKTIKALPPEKFNEDIKIFGKDVNKIVAINRAFEHGAHHRGQVTTYLKLQGIKPPIEKIL